MSSEDMEVMCAETEEENVDDIEGKGWLTLAGHQLHSLEDVDFPTTLKEVDLTLNRLKEVDPKITSLPKLRWLSMRQNLLHDITPLLQLPNPQVLEELVFNDNDIAQVPSLRSFKGLIKLDFSFNQIRTMACVDELAGAPLADLYFANNKITKIEALTQLTTLRSLELGSNRIRDIEGLESLVNLEELYLGRNKIVDIQNIDSLTKLKRLGLQSNRITRISGLENLVLLEELQLSHNGITQIEGLSTLEHIETLDLAGNKLTKLENLEGQIRMEHLWLNDNEIETLDGLEDALVACASKMKTIYLERNPAATDSEYSKKICKALPNLEQLDALLVER